MTTSSSFTITVTFTNAPAFRYASRAVPRDVLERETRALERAAWSPESVRRFFRAHWPARVSDRWRRSVHARFEGLTADEQRDACHALARTLHGLGVTSRPPGVWRVPARPASYVMIQGGDRVV